MTARKCTKKSDARAEILFSFLSSLTSTHFNDFELPTSLGKLRDKRCRALKKVQLLRQEFIKDLVKFFHLQASIKFYEDPTLIMTFANWRRSSYRQNIEGQDYRHAPILLEKCWKVLHWNAKELLPEFLISFVQMLVKSFFFYHIVHRLLYNGSRVKRPQAQKVVFAEGKWSGEEFTKVKNAGHKKENPARCSALRWQCYVNFVT